jgi:hypothetical protein
MNEAAAAAERESEREEETKTLLKRNYRKIDRVRVRKYTRHATKN